MGSFSNGTGRDQAAFMAARIPSFTHFLSSYDPSLLPLANLGPLAGGSDAADVIKNLPHATTIVAVACEGGVVMAGDRRATAGNMISKRDVEKVFRADEYSAIAIAGVMAMGLELIRLFGVELEHYEKMEGRALSIEGKANRLGKMIRDNLMAAMQGLAVIPLFAGFDEDAGVGRIFSYDAADDDSATGGPDLTRRIFPVIVTVTEDGFNRLSDSESADYAHQVVDGRMTLPDGPSAPLRIASQAKPVPR